MNERPERAAAQPTLRRFRTISLGMALALSAALALTQASHPVKAGEASEAAKGFYSFGADQIIADVNELEWAPLELEGLAPGAEIAVLRGDMAKGGSELLLRLAPNYSVPNHSHTSDETYLWLSGGFTYVAADGTRQELSGQAYISLPGGVPHALECGDEPCLLYLRYSRPFDLHIHPTP